MRFERSRRAVLTAAAMVLLALPAGFATQAQATRVEAVAVDGPVRFAFSAPTHAPRVNRAWTAIATATTRGAPLPGRVELDLLYFGKVVSHIGSGSLRGGAYRQSLRWPGRLAGQPLVVRARVSAAGRARSFLYQIRVRNR